MDTNHPDGGAPRDDKARVAELMARLAGGDNAALFVLEEEYGHRVGYMVRHQVEDMGRRDILADPDELSGLVSEAWLVIRDRASGWRPDGAMPWNWAERAIWHRVGEVIGHRVVELADEVLPDEAEPPAWEDDGEGFLLERLTPHDPRLPLLLETLHAVTTDRNYGVVVEFLEQKAYGDPSPAVTIGHRYRLEPANVRQIVRRAKVVLQGRIAEDPALAVLRDFWWLAA